MVMMFTMQQLACTAAGAGGAFLFNFIARRPLYSSIYRHLLGASAGFAIGTWLDEKQVYYDQLNKEIVADYVRMHPEDFVEERKQFKDVLIPWNPMR